MRELRYTLLSDGSSDRALLPILTWLLRTHLDDCAIQAQWADLRRLPNALKDTFPKRIEQSIDLFPCEILFIHRDAERESRQKRIDEIQTAKKEVQIPKAINLPVICVVPIRMTESWLLFDELAIRRAASNPNGSHPLSLPKLKTIENEPDPKEVLHTLLRNASGLSSRRRQRFPVSERVHRIAELIDDFSPLRVLSAFNVLETDIQQLLKQQRRNT